MAILSCGSGKVEVQFLSKRVHWILQPSKYGYRKNNHVDMSIRTRDIVKLANVATLLYGYENPVLWI